MKTKVVAFKGKSPVGPSGNPRKKLPWFPTINHDACLADLDCLNFCPQDVFKYNPETGQPIVANPYHCVPGCDVCAETCRAQGITFPSREEIREVLRRVRAEGGNADDAT